MSHVTKVETEFRDGQALETALKQVFGGCESNATMIAYYSSQNQHVDLVVRKATARNVLESSMADIGFKKVGDRYELIADEMQMPYMAKALDRLKQRYAVGVASKAAQATG